MGGGLFSRLFFHLLQLSTNVTSDLTSSLTSHCCCYFAQHIQLPSFRINKCSRLIYSMPTLYLLYTAGSVLSVCRPEERKRFPPGRKSHKLLARALPALVPSPPVNRYLHPHVGRDARKKTPPGARRHHDQILLRLTLKYSRKLRKLKESLYVLCH